MKNKLMQAGLSGEHAEMTAEVLVWSDERGYHSHGSVRMEYYCERIAKGGINTSPNFSFRTTGPCTGIYEGDNGCGYVAATHAMEHAIDMAKQNGAAVIGIRNISHSGAIGYYTEMAAKQDLLAISFCQSDPMAVPYGGTEPFSGQTRSPLPRRRRMAAPLCSIWRRRYRRGAKSSISVPGTSRSRQAGPLIRREDR